LVLSRSLRQVERAFADGEKDANRLMEAGKRTFAEEPAVRLDYFEIVNPETLDPVARISAPTLVAVAAIVGTTRLIDNLVLTP